MRERLRSWIRDFLGLPALESAVSRVDESLLVIATDLPSLTMFKAMEQKQADRHKELLEAVSERKAIQIPERRVPLYTDYEFSQTKALEDFKEKN